MHKWLVIFLKIINIRVLYAFTAVFIVPVIIVVNKQSRLNIYRYFRRRHKHGRLNAAWNTYLNHCRFSQIIIDKFAMYAGTKYKLDIENYDTFLDLSTREGGFMQLSSHIGNYELAGYSLTSHTKTMNALVFAGEKESVMHNRRRLFKGNNIRMIAMRPDMSHIFEIDAAIRNGEIVSLPADRVFGSQKTFEVTVLGAQASIPQGPFILAATRRVPLLFTCVMKQGTKRYKIKIVTLQGNPSLTTREYARELAGDYARNLDSILSTYPTQWFNYFDFWKQ